ncbi:hypothetical protein GGR26_000214 [Lewinella marina]|uniref:Uncharacterized protein n=1 Tax=Neolewinella marina TaxID=438751 RepID=A0A2G0CK38_9BACT|nr:hypothetical protein [Neolewinella marina]NJB84469.1 hypothetical protein [Neolewinella marina]PHL00339.1 hypothetical protein CGL56_04715 [Neolewinella marina]
MKLNKAAESKAKQLIEANQYVKDSDWSEAQPTTEDENGYLERHSWKEYGEWHLGIHEDASKDTKSHYGFPYGDFRRVHYSGLIAIKQRAAQQNYGEIEKAANRLLKLLN